MIQGKEQEPDSAWQQPLSKLNFVISTVVVICALMAPIYNLFQRDAMQEYRISLVEQAIREQRTADDKRREQMDAIHQDIAVFRADLSAIRRSLERMEAHGNSR